MKWGRLTLAWKPMPQFLLTIGVIVGDLLCSNLNTWIWQSKAWCQRWQGQDIVQKQLAGMYKLWFLTVFSINIATAAPPPSHQPRLLQSHLSSLRANRENYSKRSHVSNIHPSICYLTEGSEEAYQVAITKGFSTFCLLSWVLHVDIVILDSFYIYLSH